LKKVEKKCSNAKIMPNAKLMVQNINANAKMKLIQENIVKNVKYILNVLSKKMFNLKLKLLKNFK